MAYFVIGNTSIYWCAEVDSSGRFTGAFKYNYHRLPPLNGRGYRFSVMIGKIRNHLMGRYRFLGVMTDLPNPNETQNLYYRAGRAYDFEAYLTGHGMSTYALTPTQLAQLRAGQTVPGVRTPRHPVPPPRPTYEDLERVAREEEVETTPTDIARETVSFEGFDEIPAYKTDAKGFITSYDREYRRPTIEHERRGPVVKTIGKQNAYATPSLFAVLKKFYLAIPPNMVIVKRNFDDSEDGLWGPHTGRHFFMLFGNRPVAGYEFNTRSQTSGFIYIKTTIPNYNDILKRILEHMKTLSGGAPIMVINFRGDVLKNKLLEILPNTNVTVLASIKGAYKAEIRTRDIVVVNAGQFIPDRWEDDA